jgi:hypothetical protein
MVVKIRRLLGSLRSRGLTAWLEILVDHRRWEYATLNFMRRRRLFAFAIFAITLAIYFTFPTTVLYWDGVYFAQAIERGAVHPAGLLHPNHLLYNALGYELWQLAWVVDPTVRALTVLRLLNSFLGAATAGVLFVVLLDIVHAERIAACLALAFGFSATWWRFAIDADCYVPAVFVLTIAAGFVNTDRQASPLTLGVVHAAGMLLHQLAVLFYPAAVVAIWFQERARPRRQRLQSIACYTITAAGCTIGLYALAWNNNANAFRSPDFMRWLTLHSPDTSFSFTLVKNVVASLRGHVQLLVGGQRRLILDTWNGFSTLLAAVTVITVVGVAATFRRKQLVEPRCGTEPRLRPQLLVGAVWIASYVLFLLFWLPQNTFYRLFYLPAIAIVSGVFLVSKGQADRSWLPFATGALFLFNMTFHIYPQTHAAANPTVQAASSLSTVWPKDTIVYFDVNNSDNQITRYFNPQVEWVDLWGRAWISQLEESVGNASRRRRSVWFDDTVLPVFAEKDFELRQWLNLHCIFGRRIAFPNHESSVRFVELDCKESTPRSK